MRAPTVITSLESLNECLAPHDIKVCIPEEEDSCHLYVPEPTIVESASLGRHTGHKALEWRNGMMAFRLVFDQWSRPSDQKPPSPSPWVWYQGRNDGYFLTNASFSFLNLSSFYLGAQGSYEDYTRYKGNWSYTWEKVRDVKFPGRAYELIQGALSAGDDRFRYIIENFFSDSLDSVTQAILYCPSPIHVRMVVEAHPNTVQRLFLTGYSEEVTQALLRAGVLPEAAVVSDLESRVRVYQGFLDKIHAKKATCWDLLED